MQESHDEQLKTEMKKKKPDKKKFQSLMVASFEKRRNRILSLKGKRTTKQITKEYPGLESYDQVRSDNPAVCLAIFLTVRTEGMLVSK